MFLCILELFDLGDFCVPTDKYVLYELGEFLVLIFETFEI